MSTSKLFLIIGSILGFLSVAIGAFGAHQLQAKISGDMMEVYHTGVQYQMFHCLALIAVAILLYQFPHSNLLSIAGWLFILGIILFSGSLYALAISGVSRLGAITPVGGLCFLAGWVLLLIGIINNL